VPIMDGMRVFISSVMGEYFKPLRRAASDGIKALGYEPVWAEDYTALPDSPQVACLSDARSCDAAVLILGSEYGSVQDSGLSATHAEYREARDHSIPILVFIEEDAVPSAEQAEFIAEVQSWERGQYTEQFQGIGDLQPKVTQGIHRLFVSEAEAPVDADQLTLQARSLIPERSRSGWPILVVAVAAGASRPLLRPAQLESDELLRFLLDEARSGADAILDLTARTTPTSHRGTITLTQDETGASVSLQETGSIVVEQPATESHSSLTVIPAIVEDSIANRVSLALRFAGRTLDHLDQPQRVRHVAVAAAVLGGGYMPWRTREEQALSPTSATMNIFGQDRAVAELSPPTRTRAALLRDAQQMAEDLTVLLRRSATESPYQ